MELYLLTNETIDIISDQIGKIYQANGCTKKETFRAKLLLEEALIKYQRHFGEETELYFREYHVLNQTRFYVRLRTPSFDPFSMEENPMAFMIESIMNTFEGTMPTWHYRNMENEIIFSLRKRAKFSEYFSVGISVISAIVLGILSRLIFDTEKLAAFSGNYIEPLADAYAGMFCVMAVLLTLFAISLNIVDMGDLSSAGELGKQIFKRFFIVTVISVCLLSVPLLPFFELHKGSAVTIASKSLYDVLIGFIPTNLFSAFLDFNSVHIMIIGAMFGFSCLALGTKAENLVKLFRECNLVAAYTNDFLNRFIFIYVCLKVYSFITLSEFSSLSGAARMVACILVADTIIVAAFSYRACRLHKCSFSELLSAFIPSFVIAISSASFGTAAETFSEAMEKMGVDDRLSNLGTNLGSVIFQPACTVTFVISTLYMADAYGVNISVWWFLISMLLSIVLVVAMPNIPGAAVSAYTLLYAQLGLPSAALSLMIALNALLQFLTTAVDVWCLLSEVVCLSHSEKIVLD